MVLAPSTVSATAEHQPLTCRPAYRRPTGSRVGGQDARSHHESDGFGMSLVPYASTTEWVTKTSHGNSWGSKTQDLSCS